MAAFDWPIELEEGSDFDLIVEWENQYCELVDLTGYGAKLQVRNDPDDPSALVTASVSNSRIAIPANTPTQMEINIPAASVDAIKDLITEEAGYSLILWPGASTPDVDPKRLLDGPVEYSRTYTS